MGRLLLLIVVLAAIVGVIFAISYYQASQPLPTRCEGMQGTCQDECNGFNLPGDDLSRADCPSGQECCLR